MNGCLWGLQVATTQKFRKSMPEGVTVIVCKNNLMKVAVQQTTGWGALAEKGCTVSFLMPPPDRTELTKPSRSLRRGRTPGCSLRRRASHPP